MRGRRCARTPTQTAPRAGGDDDRLARTAAAIVAGSCRSSGRRATSACVRELTVHSEPKPAVIAWVPRTAGQVDDAARARLGAEADAGGRCEDVTGQTRPRGVGEVERARVDGHGLAARRAGAAAGSCRRRRRAGPAAAAAVAVAGEQRRRGEHGRRRRPAARPPAPATRRRRESAAGASAARRRRVARVGDDRLVVGAAAGRRGAARDDALGRRGRARADGGQRGAAEVARAREAVVGVLGQRALDDRVEAAARRARVGSGGGRRAGGPRASPRRCRAGRAARP